MPKVEVRLFSNLRQYQGNPENADGFVVGLAVNATLGDLLNKLKVPQGEVSVMMVNGRRQEADYTLIEGDRVGLFPLVGGG